MYVPKKKKEKIKGTMPTCSTIKGFSYFFNTKYKQRIHILKTELRSRHAVLETLQLKAGVCFFFVYADTYRDWDMSKLSITKDHHTSLPMHVASRIHEHGQQNHVHFNPISFKLKKKKTF